MSSAESTLPSPAAPHAAAGVATGFSHPPRRRLLGKYALLFIALVGSTLLVTAGFDLWFSYQENKAALLRLQQEKAVAAAERIQGFVAEIERQIGWTTHAQWAAAPLDQRRQDYFRLLRQVPAITELTQLDGEGREQLKVSRLSMDVIGSGADFSQSPAFLGAKADRVWFSPVYFRKQSEPYMTIAVARDGRNAGVTLAEINLKLIWDVITDLKIGLGGYAYVVDANGRLIAHPDISLVLRDTDLSRLPQVAAALAARRPGSRDGTPERAATAQGLAGEPVLTAHAPIAPLAWQVFVEVPLNEAFAPLYAAAARTGLLLLFGLGAAALIALVLARRMTGPIHAIAEGAERFGAGDLGRRIDVHTGDELESLAGQFNRMAADLQKSYAELEQRVVDRTAELSEALEQQTATAEVLQVINSSPGDLAPVFDAMLERATRLCDAAYGNFLSYDGECFHAVAVHGDPRLTDWLPRHGSFRPGSGTTNHRIVNGEQLVHLPDVMDDEPYRRGDPVRRALVDIGQCRTLLSVALRKDEALLGVIHVYRTEVRPFLQKEISLLQNFATQAVIAMENARLIAETREALDQQTATAEILQVINSSPGDLAPVFDAMLEKAMRLCEAAFGGLWTFDQDRYVAVALHAVPPEYARFLAKTTVIPGPGTAPYRFRNGERLAIHNHDLASEGPYQAGDSQRRALVDLGGARTALQVPLIKDDTVLGVITIYRQEVRPFAEKQIALLQNFAAQAVIAIENARLITETREALEQQTATAEVLQVINSSPGDLAPVFDAILEKAHSLCGAELGVLLTYDGECFWPVAAHGQSVEFKEAMNGGFRPRRDNPFARIIGGEPIVHIPDILDALADAQDEPGLRIAAEIGIRTFLIVPLRKENVLLGAFTANRRDVRPFTDKQIALLQNFAAQAVIAMENARLITELRDRTRDLQESLEYQTAISEVLKVISQSGAELGSVLGTVAETATRICEGVNAVIFRYEGGLLRFAAAHGIAGEYRDFLVSHPHEISRGTLVGRTASERAVVHILDVTTDPEYTFAESQQRGQLRTMLGVPLMREDALIGVLALARHRVERFADKQIELVRTFADQAVIAIENARLLNELRDRTRDLQESLEYQTATSDVLKVISQSTFDLEPVLQTVLDTAVRLCGAGASEIFRLEDGVYLWAVGHGQVPEYAEIERQKVIHPGPGTLVGRTAMEARIVHVLDAWADPLYEPKQQAHIGAYRTMLGVPLMRERVVIGVIALSRPVVQAFSEKEIELVTTFADQAVIAIENARLLNELRESLEYQTATSEVLKVMSSSAFDLDPVLRSVVSTAIRLCRADQAVIYRNLGGEYRWAAGESLAPEYEEIEREVRIRPDTRTLVGRAALLAQTVQILDCQTDPDYEVKDDARVGGIHTLLGVPLLRDGVPIGVIGLARRRIEAYTEKEIELVRTFADQAVIAIENARLLTELRERTDELARSVDELKALSEVGQAVSSTLDINDVLSTILRRSVSLTGSDAGAIFRYSRNTRTFRYLDSVGWDWPMVREVREFRVAETATALGDAIISAAPVQIPDLAERPSNPLRDAAVAVGLRSALIVPLVGPDRAFGAIVLQRCSVGEFPEATVRLMQTLASQSVLAIQNARLFREIADKSEQLAQASRHKSQFLANMSHELRTPLNAILGYTELMADGIYGELPPRAAGVLERVQNNGKHLLALINDVLDLAKIEAGQLVFTLEDYSLPDVVQSVVSATEGMARAKALNLIANVAPGLPTGHADARRLQQVLLNLVGNAVKFTDAGEVAIGAAAEDGNFVLTVRDTGPGIAPEDHRKIFEEFQQVDSSTTRKKGGTGLGLAISKRMVEMHGGTISVDSELGNGATFRVRLPIRVEEIVDEAAAGFAELRGAA